uniref:pyridoxal 5'-phosphate synthase n=1 Tax=Phallusia mammillata TaxID=59560 RepID=A0A6F9DNH3_9ASCI|nr:pyridoxine-5'-phosphate oxidase-like [Phallusia mammillata]
MAAIYVSEKKLVHIENRLEKVPVTNDPIALFNIWYDLAKSTKTIKEPYAMTLATVNNNGRPTARIVALESVGENGFKFSTNYKSPKAQDLISTPFAALVFYWPELGCSIRIEGDVEKLSEEESNKMFSGFPRTIQLVAFASVNQSAPLESLNQISQLVQNVDKKYHNMKIECPNHWGGYVVVPDRIEFYETGTSHVSKRTVFVKETNDCGTWTKGEKGWFYQKLQP